MPKHERCPRCGVRMKSLYHRVQREHDRMIVIAVGCPACLYIDRKTRDE